MSLAWFHDVVAPKRHDGNGFSACDLAGKEEMMKEQAMAKKGR